MEWVGPDGVLLAKPKTKFDLTADACTTDADCPDKTTKDADGNEVVHKYSCGTITKT